MYSGSLCADEKGESRVNWGTKKVSLILTDMLYIYMTIKKNVKEK